MKAPPPMPDDSGSTNPSTSWVAMAASTALPPSRIISSPALAACGLAAAIMRFLAMVSVTCAAAGWTGDAATISAVMHSALKNFSNSFIQSASSGLGQPLAGRDGSVSSPKMKKPRLAAGLFNFLPKNSAHEHAHFAGGGIGIGGRGHVQPGGGHAHVGHGAHHILGMTAGSGLSHLNRGCRSAGGRHRHHLEIGAGPVLQRLVQRGIKDLLIIDIGTIELHNH